MVPTLSSPSINSQAPCVDSEGGAERPAFSSTTYRSHFWSMTVLWMGSTLLRVWIFNRQEMGGKPTTRRDWKSPWKKIMTYHEKFGGKSHEFLSTEIFDDSIVKFLLLSRMQGNGLLAVLQSRVSLLIHMQQTWQNIPWSLKMIILKQCCERLCTREKMGSGRM